jgi:hypothetical protein
MSNNPDICPGTVLALSERNPLSYYPEVTHSLWTVSRVTPTQAIAASQRGEIRVRLEDLRVVGRDYTRAAIASEEMQAEHAAQVEEQARYRAAAQATDDLIDRPLHRLKLSTAQIEALAKAWSEIKAMSK